MSDTPTTRIRVRLFAMQREHVGRREIVVDVPAPASVEGAWRAVVAAYPGLEPAGPALRFARNGRYVDADEALADGDEVALIPPVAGGASGGPTEAGRVRRIELHEAPFDDALLSEVRREVPGAADGALVIFLGQTRETPGTPAPGQEGEALRHAGQHVEGLSYEAFESMALAVLAEVADEIEARFGVRRLAILHRLGEVPLGEASVLIAAAAAHRGAAFEACRYAIEELKARAPIWKSERFVGGSVWIGAPARTGPRDPSSES